jgi:hypothetical protein
LSIASITIGIFYFSLRDPVALHLRHPSIAVSNNQHRPKMTFPIYWDIPPESHYPYIATASSQIYSTQNEYAMEYPPSWDPNLDPSLRGADNGMTSNQNWDEEQPMQRRLIGKDESLFMGTHMLQSKSPPLQIKFNGQYEAIRPIPPPRPYDQVGESPSSCSSALSPRTEFDWFQDGFPHCQSFEGGSPSRSSPHLSQGFSEHIYPSKTHVQLPVPIIKHINLSDVQGFADPQEVTFQDDEGYMDIDTKTEEVIEVETRIGKPQGFRGHYHHPSDEGIGQSVKDEESPVPDTSEPVANGNVEVDDDADADGEDIDEEGKGPEIEEEEYEDTEYNPRASRAGTKRRRSTRISPTSQTAKKSRVAKNVSRSKSKLQCKDCHHNARDGTALAKHIASQHTRHYVCTFSFSGCNSTFGNKNEWKRHVASQHLGLQYWLCNVGLCGQGKASHSSKSPSSTRAKGNDFNRKDLFTQHLRRMHAPFSVKRQHRKNDEWEERVKELQSSCLKTRRHPPVRTRCPVRECAVVFDGPNSWDDRMEHVGRHLEKTSPAAVGAEAANASAVNKDIIDQESDEFMIEWALAERIIERKASGGYKFCNDSGGQTDEEKDAEGEDE